MAAVQERQAKVEAVVEAVEGRPVERLSQDIVSAAYGDGVLVDLAVRRGSVTERLKPEDLGLAPTQETEKKLRDAAALGSKLLLPREIVGRLKAIEQAGRTSLKRRSFRTLFGHFVPCTAYAAWKEDYERLRKEFYDVRNDAIARHGEIVEDMRKLWLELAPELYRDANKGEDPPEGHAERVADRMAAKVLSPQRIADGFEFEQSVRLVPIPSAAEADMLAQDRLRRARRMGDERAALVEEFEADLESVYADRRKNVEDFAASMQAQLAEAVASLCREAHGALKGRKAIPVKTADKLRRLLVDAKTLNFMDDAAMAERIASVESALEASDVTPTTLARTLEAVHAEAIQEVERSDDSFELVWRLDDEALQ